MEEICKKNSKFIRIITNFAHLKSYENYTPNFLSIFFRVQSCQQNIYQSVILKFALQNGKCSKFHIMKSAQ